MTAASRLRVLGLWIALVLSAAATAAPPTVSVDKRGVSLASGGAFTFKLNLPRPRDVSLKIYDPAGKFVRALTQKQFTDKELTKELSLPWDLKDAGGKAVAPGVYTARFEAVLGLKLDRTFASDGLLKDKAFVSPAILRLDKQGNLYLLDVKTATLFKFTPDGAPANDWNGKNSFKAPQAPYWGGLAVEPDGSRIYLAESSTTTHVVDAFDGKTAERLNYIGGFFGDDPEWRKEKGGMAYPLWVGLNGDAKLYTTSPGYGRIFAFDRHKVGKPAGVWQIGGEARPRVGWSSGGDCGDTDGVNGIYLASYEFHGRGEVFKILDLGESGDFAYGMTQYADPKTKKDVFLSDIYAIAHDGEQGLYLVERGPARIVKIADSGTRLEFVAILGTRGKDPASLGFVAPRGAAVSPDGKFLYIVEDGEPVSKTNTTTGPAHVVRYKIGYADRKFFKLTVKP